MFQEPSILAFRRNKNNMQKYKMKKYYRQKTTEVSKKKKIGFSTKSFS